MIYDSYPEIRQKIEAHPAFNKLVREVAVAEPLRMPGLPWLERNSRTFGAWVHNGSEDRYRGGRRRARNLARQIADELWPDGDERIGYHNWAYGTAHEYVRARVFHHG